MHLEIGTDNNMANLQSTVVYDANSLLLPKGTTAERPASPTNGAIRYNTDLGYTEIYKQGTWVKLTTPIASENLASVATTSGTHIVHNNHGYRIHNFLSGSHTFTPLRTGYVEVLVVAGGGGGGGRPYHGGGGGGGGVIYRSAYAVQAGTDYTVTVGEGGTGYNNTTSVLNGKDSVFGNLIAIGGGGGGGSTSGDGPGYAGGSGGGASVRNSTGGAGTRGQGNDGGSGQLSPETPNYGAGGGGGAGGIGGKGTTTTGGDGGPGLPFSISGRTSWYAGGGGGSTYANTRGGIGGAGGGGTGVYGVGGQNGEPNTGGGGGGRDNRGPEYRGQGNGGSGIVIVRYLYNSPLEVVHVFRDVGTRSWTAPAGVEAADILVVGGGGGGGGYGGNDGAGGGGAGGMVYVPNYRVSPGSTYNVTVGNGAASATSQGQLGNNGSDSDFAGVLIGRGGGGGGTEGAVRVGQPGGSGGGAGGYGVKPGGAGIALQGNRGGDCTGPGDGGGGGAGEAGASGTSGKGGDGLPCPISGSVQYYAGGGGASGDQRNTRGRWGAYGGRGGGGRGGHAVANETAENGVNGTGGGGGGAPGTTTTYGAGTVSRSGRGGSGIVIIRYRTPI